MKNNEVIETVRTFAEDCDFYGLKNICYVQSDGGSNKASGDNAKNAEELAQMMAQLIYRAANKHKITPSILLMNVELNLKKIGGGSRK